MPINTDFEIQADKNIRYIGDVHGGASPGYYTVLELHRWLQDLADNATETGDDFMSIIRQNPSERSTDNIITLLNGFNIDDEAAEHLYDGSIIQANGDEIYDGFINFGNTAFLQIVQNGTLLANDYWNEASHTAVTGNAAAGVSHRFLLKVRTGGADIDLRKVLGLTRNFGFTYSEFAVNGTSRGNNVLALSEQIDLNNQTAEGTVGGWNGITNTQGYQLIDLVNGNGPQPYYSQWNRDVFTINQLYERAKWLTRAGSSSTLYGLDGKIFRGITHEIPVDSPTNTFAAFEAVSWSGGTGQMLAINSTTAPTKMWIQLLTGNPPTNGQVITGASTATCTVNGTVTTRNVTNVFLGQSTGSAIIGAFGVGIESSDLSVNDTVTDLLASPQSPPNNQTFTVSGLVAGEDRVLVTQNDGGDEIDYDQFSALADGSNPNTAGANTLRIGTTIPSDTPLTGVVYAFDGTRYARLPYTAYAGQVFTLSGTLPSNISNAANVFIAYIDTLASSGSASYTATYSTDRNLVVKVRDGGVTPIKPFKSPATFGAGGGSIAAIRTTDT